MSHGFSPVIFLWPPAFADGWTDCVDLMGVVQAGREPQRLYFRM